MRFHSLALELGDFKDLKTNSGGSGNGIQGVPNYLRKGIKAWILAQDESYFEHLFRAKSTFRYRAY